MLPRLICHQLSAQKKELLLQWQVVQDRKISFTVRRRKRADILGKSTDISELFQCPCEKKKNIDKKVNKVQHNLRGISLHNVLYTLCKDIHSENHVL